MVIHPRLQPNSIRQEVDNSSHRIATRRSRHNLGNYNFRRMPRIVASGEHDWFIHPHGGYLPEPGRKLRLFRVCLFSCPRWFLNPVDSFAGQSSLNVAFSSPDVQSSSQGLGAPRRQSLDCCLPGSMVEKSPVGAGRSTQLCGSPAFLRTDHLAGVSLGPCRGNGPINPIYGFPLKHGLANTTNDWEDIQFYDENGHASRDFKEAARATGWTRSKPSPTD